MKKRFLVADNQALICEAVKHILRKYFSQAEVDTVRTLRAMPEEEVGKFDVVIVDPVPTDVRAIDVLKPLYPRIRVLVYSSLSANFYYQLYRQGKIDGYVSKAASMFQFIEALNQLVQCKRFIPPEFRGVAGSSSVAQSRGLRLSEIELDVLYHLLRGQGVSSIAAELNKHISTIATHKTRIMEKFEAESLVDLEVAARIHGLV